VDLYGDIAWLGIIVLAPSTFADYVFHGGMALSSLLNLEPLITIIGYDGSTLQGIHKQ
jgi:hypothetical protein